MELLNECGKAIDTITPPPSRLFETLFQLGNEEPVEVLAPLERFYMQAIGIEKGRPLPPMRRPRRCCRKPRGPER